MISKHNAGEFIEFGQFAHEMSFSVQSERTFEVLFRYDDRLDKVAACVHSQREKLRRAIYSLQLIFAQRLRLTQILFSCSANICRDKSAELFCKYPPPSCCCGQIACITHCSSFAVIEFSIMMSGITV